jgi:DNA invertase Pin-like site-specific DNA recombinase
VFASVAEWERATIAARTKAGRAVIRAQGKPISRPSLADRPELRSRIAAMRAAGMTLQAIADTLNTERMPTLRGGSHWRTSSVRSAAGWTRRKPRRQPTELPVARRSGTASSA